MGAEAYHYQVDVKDDLNSVFLDLRETVFSTGNYRYSGLNPSTISEALENAEEEGTASILDLAGVSENHQMGHLSPLRVDEYESYFNTNNPTLEQIKGSKEFWASIGRFEARSVVAFKEGSPFKLFIAGFSVD